MELPNAHIYMACLESYGKCSTWEGSLISEAVKLLRNEVVLLLYLHIYVYCAYYILYIIYYYI